MVRGAIHCTYEVLSPRRVNRKILHSHSLVSASIVVANLWNLNQQLG